MNILYLYGKLIKKLHGKCVINSKIHQSSKIGPGSNIVGSTLGKYSYCGPSCQLVNAKIGSFCSISDHVFIGGAEHPMEWISTSPVFQNNSHSGPKKRFAKFDVPETKETIVGNDVWIGHGATIKQGVVIGDGAVVGSGALVTKDVPPYSVVGGVPSKVIKFRFSTDVIECLEKFKWWDLPDEKIAKIINLFNIPNPTVADINNYISMIN